MHLQKYFPVWKTIPRRVLNIQRSAVQARNIFFFPRLGATRDRGLGQYVPFAPPLHGGEGVLTNFRFTEIGVQVPSIKWHATVRRRQVRPIDGQPVSARVASSAGSPRERHDV